MNLKGTSKEPFLFTIFIFLVDTRDKQTVGTVSGRGLPIDSNHLGCLEYDQILIISGPVGGGRSSVETVEVEI